MSAREENGMELRVNRVTVPLEAVAREATRHPDAPDPEIAARRALATRELLLQRAGELGLLEGGRPRAEVAFADRDAEDAVIGAVLDAEVITPEPDDDACRRVFASREGPPTVGELVEARHILFAVTTGTPVGALRAEAEKTLQALRREPSAFASVAQRLSNCPSGAQGGNLGQFGRGQMVPEFDQAVFATEATGVLPSLVSTRHGFHVVLVERRVPGRPLTYEEAKDSIAAWLASRVQAQALRQYLRMLAGRATIEGVELESAATPLVQ